MATLNIGGKRVTVGDEFLQMSPEAQNAAVEEIAASIGTGRTPSAYDAAATDALETACDIMRSFDMFSTKAWASCSDILGTKARGGRCCSCCCPGV